MTVSSSFWLPAPPFLNIRNNLLRFSVMWPLYETGDLHQKHRQYSNFNTIKIDCQLVHWLGMPLSVVPGSLALLSNSCLGFDAPGMFAPAFLPEALAAPQNIATLRLASAALLNVACINRLAPIWCIPGGTW
jgi:hypothetical protein